MKHKDQAEKELPQSKTTTQRAFLLILMENSSMQEGNVKD